MGNETLLLRIWPPYCDATDAKLNARGLQAVTVPETPKEPMIAKAWRGVWGASSFFLFGIGALLFGLLIAPLLWILVWRKARRQRLARRSVADQDQPAMAIVLLCLQGLKQNR